MPGARWPQLVLDEARQAYETGVPVGVIAAGIGIPHQVVSRWAKTYRWTCHGFRLSMAAEVAMMKTGKWVRSNALSSCNNASTVLGTD